MVHSPAREAKASGNSCCSPDGDGQRQCSDAMDSATAPRAASSHSLRCDPCRGRWLWRPLVAMRACGNARPLWPAAMGPLRNKPLAACAATILGVLIKMLIVRSRWLPQNDVCGLRRQKAQGDFPTASREGEKTCTRKDQPGQSGADDRAWNVYPNVGEYEVQVIVVEIRACKRQVLPRYKGPHRY
jgi:hypothetical protein